MAVVKISLKESSGARNYTFIQCHSLPHGHRAPRLWPQFQFFSRDYHTKPLWTGGRASLLLLYIYVYSLCRADIKLCLRILESLEYLEIEQRSCRGNPLTFRIHYILSSFSLFQFAVLYPCLRLFLNILKIKTLKIYFMYSNTVYILSDI